jgi:hypothetical protein
MNDSTNIFAKLPSKVQDDITFTPEIVSLKAGDSQVRIIIDGGQEIVLPFKLLAPLSNNARNFHGTLVQTLDEQRFKAYNPIERSGQDGTPEVVTGTRKNRTISLPGADLEADATPFMFWVKDENKPGWALTLAGINDQQIGFAAWDDVNGQNELINSMNDPETLLTIAAIVASTPTAQMSARMAARALRTARTIPTMEPKKVRTVLETANLIQGADATGSGSRYSAGRIRAIKIKSGTAKEVTVAVGVLAPASMPWLVPLTDEEKRTMDWKARSQEENRRKAEAQTPWVEATKNALTAAGYRIVSIGEDRRKPWYGEEKIIWATLIDPETWGSVSAAATVEAKNLEMTRGSIIFPALTLPATAA